MIIDAHHHLWKIEHGIYDWIGDEISGIRRDYQPEHLQPYLSHLKIDKTILVQAAETLKENELMLDAAENNSFIGGVVAWVDLLSDTCASELDFLASKPIIKGIRPVLQGIDDTNWILRDEVMRNLSSLPRLNLRFDALIQPRHLNAMETLARQIPDLSVVIDHGAKPIIKNGQAPDQQWLEGIAKLAEYPNIYCKISGLITEYGAGWSAKALQPVTHHLLDTFSPKRIMWGSDWPVLELDGSYTQWFSCILELITDLSAQEQKRILGETAREFYAIE